MKLTGIRKSDIFTEKFNNYDLPGKQDIERTQQKLAYVISQAASPAQIPISLNKPSNTKPFRRAKIDKDLRLYWWIDEDRVLVFHDICNHKEARIYDDVHK